MSALGETLKNNFKQKYTKTSLKKAKVNKSLQIFDKICLREIGAKYLLKSIAERNKATIASGSGLSKIVKELLEDLGIPRIKKADVYNYQIRNVLEAYLFEIWRYR